MIPVEAAGVVVRDDQQWYTGMPAARLQPPTGRRSLITSSPKTIRLPTRRWHRVSGSSAAHVFVLPAFCEYLYRARVQLQINRRPAEYWGRVMEIARLNNLSRVQRCGQIMGRSDAGEMSSAQIFYPCMQVLRRLRQLCVSRDGRGEAGLGVWGWGVSRKHR